jgi:hypothetical protein
MMTESTKRIYKQRLASTEFLLEDEKQAHLEMREMCAKLMLELDQTEHKLAEARVRLSAWRDLFRGMMRRPTVRFLCKKEFARGVFIETEG